MVEEQFRIPRRQFLSGSAGAIVTGLAGASLVAEDRPSAKQSFKKKQEPIPLAGPAQFMIPVIDTHQHLWDLDILRLPWLGERGSSPLANSFVTKDYLVATAGLNVVKTVYMEVAVADDYKQIEADYVIDLCQRDDNPMAAAVISYHPGRDGFEEFVKQYDHHQYIKGIRQVLHESHTPPGMCCDDKIVRRVQLLGELGMSFDLCMRPQELNDGATLAEKSPKTRFVLDHCGNMPIQSVDKALRATWEAGIKRLASLPNVVCKISGIVASAERPEWTNAELAGVIEPVIEAFGEDRIMFAGDWPVCTTRATFAEWLNALKAIVSSRSERFQQKLFFDNAQKFYWPVG